MLCGWKSLESELGWETMGTSCTYLGYCCDFDEIKRGGVLGKGCSEGRDMQSTTSEGKSYLVGDCRRESYSVGDCTREKYPVDDCTGERYQLAIMFRWRLSSDGDYVQIAARKGGSIAVVTKTATTCTSK